MADRLYIEKNINDFVVIKIDSTKFMNLDKFSIERIELFMFAMDLGIREDKSILPKRLCLETGSACRFLV